MKPKRFKIVQEGVLYCVYIKRHWWSVWEYVHLLRSYAEAKLYILDFIDTEYL